MKEYDFYKYDEYTDSIKLYCENIQSYFESHYKIIVNSIDFDTFQNVVLYIEDTRSTIISSELEKQLLEEIEHLNDAEVRNMKIVLIFDCNQIELS
jgi:hypothetical protein